MRTERSCRRGVALDQERDYRYQTALDTLGVVLAGHAAIRFELPGQVQQQVFGRHSDLSLVSFGATVTRSISAALCWNMPRTELDNLPRIDGACGGADMDGDGDALMRAIGGGAPRLAMGGEGMAAATAIVWKAPGAR